MAGQSLCCTCYYIYLGKPPTCMDICCICHSCLLFLFFWKQGWFVLCGVPFPRSLRLQADRTTHTPARGVGSGQSLPTWPVRMVSLKPQCWFRDGHRPKKVNERFLWLVGKETGTAFRYCCLTSREGCLSVYKSSTRKASCEMGS